MKYKRQNKGQYLRTFSLNNTTILQITFSAEQCAQGAVQVIELASTGSVWIVEGGEKPYEYVMPDRFKFTEKHYVTS